MDWEISIVLVLRVVVIRPPSLSFILPVKKVEMALLLKETWRVISRAENSTSLNLHHKSSTCSLVFRKHLSQSTDSANTHTQHDNQSTAPDGAGKTVKETTWLTPPFRGHTIQNCAIWLLPFSIIPAWLWPSTYLTKNWNTTLLDASLLLGLLPLSYLLHMTLSSKYVPIGIHNY